MLTDSSSTLSADQARSPHAHLNKRQENIWRLMTRWQRCGPWVVEGNLPLCRSILSTYTLHLFVVSSPAT